MADLKKKSSAALYTHWARPRVRTYQYNYEYSESYYRPMVRYISTSRALSAASTSSNSYSSSSSYNYRRSRQGSPPGALSFIERWTYEPFYGYGIGFRSKQSSDRSYSSAFQSSSQALSSSSRRVAEDFSRSVRAQSASRSVRAQSVAAMQRESSVSRSSATNIRSSRARSVAAEDDYGYASDDCLMRSNAALRRARAVSEEIMNTSSLTNKTLCLDNQNVLHGRTLDERCYLDYPKQHLVCSDSCPLHNCPEWRRRFLIGNRFLDAAALGGFDVLYDPSVYKNSRRLLSKLSERNESDSEEVLIQRSTESDASRRRIRATSHFV